jgi:hypothetical protein
MEATVIGRANPRKRRNKCITREMYQGRQAPALSLHWAARLQNAKGL